MTATSPPTADFAVMGVPAGSTAAGARRVRRRRDRRRRGRTLTGWILLVLAAAALWPAQFGGVTGLTIVHGESMQPTYDTGDVVLTVRMPAYQIGDVISYTVPDGQPGAGGHVIHRIDTVAGAHYTTIGDNNTTADEWLISNTDITGKAFVHLPGAGVFFTPQVLPYLVALALGGIVTVLLWSPARRAGDDAHDGEAHDGGTHPVGAAR